jgi:glycosyltransferase involved in cell wall biosynthesis
MRVLVLAPQPFYQERGTPIAVKLAVETLSKKLLEVSDQETPIDLLVYNEGQDIEIPGVRIIRIKTPGWLRGVRPGISCKKLACDLLLFFHTILLIWRARSQQYDVIHAVEESVFIAWLAKKLFGIPYIYDMDSSLALQLTEKWWWCKPALSVLQYLEGVAVRGSVSVAPVCDALQAIAVEHGSASTVMLRDVSLLPPSNETAMNRTELFGAPLSSDDRVVVYVGNLESYQGIDLLLESFARAHQIVPAAWLVIVGGNQTTIERYRLKAAKLGCDSRVVFLGPRPIHQLSALLGSADILVSPRIKGNNTPMKVYSYLHSGTALLATDLPTHQQVLNNSVALLAPANSVSFSEALVQLLRDEALRKRLGEAARTTAQKLYTVEAFEMQITKLYEDVARSIGKPIGSAESMHVINQ